MVRSILALFALSFTLFAVTPTARADGFGPSATDSPSVFSYGYHGLLLGGLVGVSGAYLGARPDGIDGEDWRPLVLGTGIGALTGSAIGFGLGLSDLAADRPGRGNIALRDMGYGAGFGLLAGAVTGSLVVVRTGDAEHILLGSAIGTLAGTGLGLAIGIFEGRRIVESPAHRGPREKRHFTATISAAEDVRGGLVWMPAFVGRM